MSKHDLLVMQDLVAKGEFALANKSTESDVLELGWDTAMIQAFVSCLRGVHFHKSLDGQFAFGRRLTVDLDVYRMYFDEENRQEGNGDCCRFYTKLALYSHKDGRSVAIVSLHLG